jgi:hypothetical protein
MPRFVGILETPHLPFKLFDPLLLSTGDDARPLARVNLSLQHPPAQRFATDLNLTADHLARGIHRPILTEVIEHHLHRSLALLHWVMLRAAHLQQPSNSWTIGALA